MTVQNKKFLICTEAGSQAGFGHLVRCLSVFDCAVEYFSSQMLVQIDSLDDLEIVERISGNRDITVCEWRETDFDLSVTCDAIVLVDSYLLNRQTLVAIILSARNVCILDDFVRDLPSSVINPNIYFSDIRNLYHNSEVTGGKNFVLLRSELGLVDRKNSVRTSLKKIFVTFGGASWTGAQETIVSYLIDLGFHVFVNRDTCNFATGAVCVGRGLDASTLYRYYLDCDMVICGAGQTLHELVYLRVPFIPVLLGSDQNFFYEWYKRIMGGNAFLLTLDTPEIMINLPARFDYSKYVARYWRNIPNLNLFGPKHVLDHMRERENERTRK